MRHVGRNMQHIGTRIGGADGVDGGRVILGRSWDSVVRRNHWFFMVVLRHFRLGVSIQNFEIQGHNTVREMRCRGKQDPLPGP